MSSKKKSLLADKINDLITSAPKHFGSDDESDDTKAKVIEYDDSDVDLEDFKHEFNSLKIRKQNVNLLEDSDKRYKGKKVSKKDIFNDDENFDEIGNENLEESDNELSDSDDKDDSISLQFSEKNDSDEILSQKSENSDENQSQISENSDENISKISEDFNENLSQKSEDFNEVSSKYSENYDEISSKHSEDELDEGDISGEIKSPQENHDQSDFEDEFLDSINRLNPLLRDKTGGIKTMNTVNIREELEKGNCVSEQLNMWENFLEMRIKLQKLLVNSNKMPQYDTYKNYESNNEFKTQSTTVKHKLTDLLNNLLHLQSSLLNNFSETKNILTKSKKIKMKKKNESIDEKIDEENEIIDDSMNEEIPSDTEDEMNDSEEIIEEQDLKQCDTIENKGPPRKKIKFSEFENILNKNHKSYSEYRDSVIQKWNDRTRIASGVISKKATEPTLKQIEYILMNKDKLLKKTQLKRSEYDIIGKISNSLKDNNELREQVYDPEIFDDDDFYHQLLRDLIEYKSTDVVDPIQLSKQWVQLQNMRKKMKRKIDTRATKGRRLRYDVHEKLVNFMAPIEYNTWTDQAKDDLYNSLFGKIKPAQEKRKEEKRNEEKRNEENNEELKST